MHPASANRASRQVARLQFGDAALDGRFGGLVEQLTVLDLPAALFGIPPTADRFWETAGDPDGSGARTVLGSFDALFDTVVRLRAAGSGSVIIDSLTALQRPTEFGLHRGRVIGFLTGLRAAAGEWDALVDVLYRARPEQVRPEHTVNGVLGGCLYFYADEGTSAADTTRVGEFSGALGRPHQVVYETRVGRGVCRLDRAGGSDWCFNRGVVSPDSIPNL